jgi:CheY-like chemotaxis protein
MLSGKVLIVDDDIRIVIALTQLLGRVGLPAVYALNGREGIEVLERPATTRQPHPGDRTLTCRRDRLGVSICPSSGPHTWPAGQC